MTPGTFQIATTLNGKSRRDHPFVGSFEAHGEVWCIHRRIQGLSYTVSHKASGFSIPTVDAVTAEEAKGLAMAFLEARKDQISKVLASIMNQ